MAKFLSWFATKKGKLFTRSCVGIIGVSIFSTQLAIHGPLQDKAREMCQLYDDGKARRISSQLNLLIKNVLKDCDLDHQEKKRLKFFNVVGIDLFHFGGIKSPWGAMIGIPFYFDDYEGNDFSKIRIRGHEDTDWIVEGQDLFEALSLSENAKKFALMRELYSCNVSDILDNASLNTGSFFVCAEFIRRMNVKRDAFNSFSFRARSVFYIASYLAAYLFYSCVQNPMKHISDKNADRSAALIGPEYLEGGIEFYEKLLLRNKTFRQLLGSKGESKYDENGNENYLLFPPMLPTKKRLDYLQELKKEQKTVPA